MMLEFALAALVATTEIRTLKPGQASPPATIGDVAWIAGDWIGAGLGGCAEERMAPPADGQIMGMFRLLKADGSLIFYEFYTISEVGGSLLFRIKHFGPDLVGWEEKDKSAEFPLVAIEGQTAFFSGLTWSRERDALRASVRIEGAKDAVFDYRAAKPSEACPAS